MEASAVRVPSRPYSVTSTSQSPLANAPVGRPPSSYVDSRNSLQYKPRQSSETAIVSIYSMYGNERGSWAASRALSSDLSKTQSIVPQVTLALPDNGSLDGDYDTELAYFSDRPPTVDLGRRQRESSPRISAINSAHLRGSDTTNLTLPSQSEESSISSFRMSNRSSRPYSVAADDSPDSLRSRNTLSPNPQYRFSSPPNMPQKHATETVMASKTSLVPSDGEDIDAFHVRNTYALLEMSGVRGDGYEDGVERTRARVGDSRASQVQAQNAIADGTEKNRDLTQEEVRTLESVDRYGFFSTPSHDRLVLLPALPLQKRLAPSSAGPPTAPTSATSLSKLPVTTLPPKETARIAKWNRMLEAEQRDSGANVQIWRVRPSKVSKYTERVYKGIPDCWRAAAWDNLLRRFSKTGAAETEELGKTYRDTLDRPSSYDIQIDLDVPRTIAGHIMFRTRYGAGQRSLFHVLHSFSLRCEDCGYVQGMGPIAATLLCYFDAERVYASLVRLHDAYDLHSIFLPGFPGLLEAIYVQERITEEMMPAVYAAFKKHMVSTTSYATKWYITLFANSVPFQTQLRLWDAFLLEGPDLFVAMAVAIVWAYRDHITATNANFETILSLLSSFFVPENEDALLFWIEKTLGDGPLRAKMTGWRKHWKHLVAEGKEGDVLL